MQKEIKNVDTLISVALTFLTSLDLFTPPFLRGDTDRQSETAEKEGKRRKKKEKKIWGKQNKGKMGFRS